MGVSVSAGDCECKLSVCALFQHNYSSTPFMFAVCVIIIQMHCVVLLILMHTNTFEENSIHATQQAS